MAKYNNDLNGIVTLFQALSDENRVRAFAALRQGELCVCQIVELLQLAPSTVSKHMSILRQAGLVQTRKEGRWVFYRLAGCAENEDPSGAACCLLQACCEGEIGQSLRTDRRIQDDRKRIKEILKMDPEELCRKQCSC